MQAATPVARARSWRPAGSRTGRDIAEALQCPVLSVRMVMPGRDDFCRERWRLQSKIRKPNGMRIGSGEEEAKPGAIKIP